jgi:hypothetical protein
MDGITMSLASFLGIWLQGLRKDKKDKKRKTS